MEPFTLACLIPDCGRIYRTRGLCYRCYAALTLRIKKGELTWEQAEQQGKCLKPKPLSIRRFGYGYRRCTNIQKETV